MFSRRSEILALAAHHGATNVRVFGSVARGEDDAASNIDILVDVVTEKGLRPTLRERVLQKAIAL